MLIQFDTQLIIAVLRAWKQSTLCAQHDVDREYREAENLKESFTRGFTLNLLMKNKYDLPYHFNQAIHCKTIVTSRIYSCIYFSSAIAHIHQNKIYIYIRTVVWLYNLPCCILKNSSVRSLMLRYSNLNVYVLGDGFHHYFMVWTVISSFLIASVLSLLFILSEFLTIWVFLYCMQV